MVSQQICALQSSPTTAIFQKALFYLHRQNVFRVMVRCQGRLIRWQCRILPSDDRRTGYPAADRALTHKTRTCALSFLLKLSAAVRASRRTAAWVTRIVPLALWCPYPPTQPGAAHLCYATTVSAQLCVSVALIPASRDRVTLMKMYASASQKPYPTKIERPALIMARSPLTERC